MILLRSLNDHIMVDTMKILIMTLLKMTILEILNIGDITNY
jgi:hypothetical protein